MDPLHFPVGSEGVDLGTATDPGGLAEDSSDSMAASVDLGLLEPEPRRDL